MLLLLLALHMPAEVDLRVRCDPFVTLVAGGASVGLDVMPRVLDSRLSVAAFVVDVPRVMVPLVIPGGTQSMKITESVLQLGWFTSSEEQHRGFFFGPELYAYQLRTVDEAAAARGSVVSYEVYFHATLGWTWFFFEDSVFQDVFIMPWATAGLPMFGTGDAVFPDGTVIEDRVFNWHATISVGLQL